MATNTRALYHPHAFVHLFTWIVRWVAPFSLSFSFVSSFVCLLQNQDQLHTQQPNSWMVWAMALGSQCVSMSVSRLHAHLYDKTFMHASKCVCVSEWRGETEGEREREIRMGLPMEPGPTQPPCYFSLCLLNPSFCLAFWHGPPSMSSSPTQHGSTVILCAYLCDVPCLVLLHPIHPSLVSLVSLASIYPSFVSFLPSFSTMAQYVFSTPSWDDLICLSHRTERSVHVHNRGWNQACDSLLAESIGVCVSEWDGGMVMEDIKIFFVVVDDVCCVLCIWTRVSVNVCVVCSATEPCAAGIQLQLDLAEDEEAGYDQMAGNQNG